jgi:hypothetical protein
VVDAVAHGDDGGTAKIEEAIAAIARLVKS